MFFAYRAEGCGFSADFTASPSQFLKTLTTGIAQNTVLTVKKTMVK